MLTKLKPLFDLGHVLATTGAATHVTPEWAHDVLQRHTTGDYGDIDRAEAMMNDRAIHTGRRIISAYTTPDGVKVWLITEADRRCTTFLLPDEY